MKITQVGWDDYWTKLTAELHRGHPAGRLHRPHPEVRPVRRTRGPRPLDELGPPGHRGRPTTSPVSRAKWIGQDGHRYGAPKDWDTVALFYNKKMAKAAGSDRRRAQRPRPGTRRTAAPSRRPSPSSPSTRTGGGATSRASTRTTSRCTAWPPTTRGDADGQTQWSPFTGSAGWNYTDKNALGHALQLRPARPSSRSIKWYFGLAEKGYMAPFTDYSAVQPGPDTQIGSGKAADRLARLLDDLAPSRASRASTSAPPSPRTARPANAPP